MNKQKSFTLTGLNYYTNKIGDVTELFNTPGGLGSLASARLQMLPSLIAAQQLGATQRLVSLHSSQPELLDTLQPSDVCIIGKLSANTDELAHNMIMANLAAAIRLKNTGSTIILQYCDHHLNQSKKHPLYKLYQDLFCLADHVVYPSNKLQQLANSSISNNAKQHVICDPWQISKQYSYRKLIHEDICRIIWFGSSINTQYLINQLKSIISQQSASINFELTILTQAFSINNLKEVIPSLNIVAPNWTVRFVCWSNNRQPDQLEHELARAHIAIIPSDPNDPAKMGVSHNRVVDSARAGCLVIASPMDSYIEIKEICLLGNNIGEILSKAMSNYAEISIKNNIACKRTLQRFSPLENILRWKQLWEEVLYCKSP